MFENNAKSQIIISLSVPKKNSSYCNRSIHYVCHAKT